MDFFNLEAEEVLLGTIILNNNQITKVDDILEAKHFYRLENSKILINKAIQR
jgi:replicative DNA helicase